jgi:hypothetical protein
MKNKKRAIPPLPKGAGDKEISVGVELVPGADFYFSIVFRIVES